MLQTISVCILLLTIGPFSGSVTSIFFFLILINVFLFALMMTLGFLIAHFSDMDPDQLKSIGLIQKILTAYCRICPKVLKLIHYIKTIIVIIVAFFAKFSKLDITSLNSENYNTNLTSSFNKECLNVTASTIMKNTYDLEIIIFEIIEAVSVVLVICCLSLYRNRLDINPYVYEPDHPNDGFFKIAFKQLGP